MTDPSTSAAPARRGWTRRDTLLLAALAAVALSVRVVHVLAMRDSPYFERPIMDAAYHLDWARAILAGERYPSTAPYFRAPLYPWLLAALLKVCGGSLLGVRLVQSLLGVATVVLTTLLGRRLFGRAAGFVAGGLAALSWVLVYYDGELLIPVLSVPLDLAALLLSLSLADRPSARRAGLAGLAWGLAAIARPNVLVFLPVLAVWVAWRAAGPLGRRLVPAAALALGALAPILPLTVRNRVVGGDWVLVSSQAGVNLWIGNNPESDGSTAIVPGTRGGWWEGYHDSIAQAEAAEGRALRPSEVSGHYSAKAWDWMLSHPGAALRHLAWKTRLFLTNAELGNNLDVAFFARHYDPLARWSPVRFDLLLGLGALGVVLGFRRGRDLPAWAFLLVYSASVVLFFVCARFRVPILPVAMAYSGGAIVWLAREVRARRVARAGAGLALAALVAVLSDLRPRQLVPSEANGRLALGEAALLAGDAREAAAQFEAALAAKPDHALAVHGLARAARAQGDLPRAERVLRAYLEDAQRREAAGAARAPGGPEMRAELTDTLVEAGRAAEALALSEPWLERDSRSALLAYARGRAFAALQRPEEAAREMERARALDPGLLAAYDALEYLYGRMGRAGDAQRVRAERETVAPRVTR